jgi:hypothetical protein
MQILDADMYEKIIRLGLQSAGLSAQQAEQIASFRYPLQGYGILQEAAGRGIALEPRDLLDWLSSDGSDPDLYGEDILDLTLSRNLFEMFLTWCLDSCRGTATGITGIAAHNPHMLADCLEAWGKKWN